LYVHSTDSISHYHTTGDAGKDISQGQMPQGSLKQHQSYETEIVIHQFIISPDRVPIHMLFNIKLQVTTRKEML
jgi:hypothetical protein